MINLKEALKLGALSTLLVSSTGVVADQVILDDLIVDGSICAGMDCVNGESFGFDTLRLKENNLRIGAVDTSNSASFPSRDWQITFNDSNNGGQNKFSIDDIDGGRTPFTIEAGAPSHSLYVDDGGRLGLGTSTPVADVHVKSGNTPTLRLEQDGTSGFSAQVWDVAGNEANFFVRDATNSSTLPFRIAPGAPNNAISIEASTGHVGMGIQSPEAALHIKENVAGAPAMLHLENTGGSFIQMEQTDDGESWYITHENAVDGRLIFNHDANAGALIAFSDNGDVSIVGSLITGTAGSCELATPCDGVFRPDEFTVDSIEDHADFMWTNQYLKAVGPTSKDEPFNVTRKTTGILHELETAHIYIEQLNAQMKAMQKKIDQLTENTEI